MHSSESLRDLRALNYFLDYCCGQTSHPQRPVEKGKIIGKLVYNLKTRTLKVIDLRQKPGQVEKAVQTA